MVRKGAIWNAFILIIFLGHEAELSVYGAMEEIPETRVLPDAPFALR